MSRPAVRGCTHRARLRRGGVAHRLAQAAGVHAADAEAAQASSPATRQPRSAPERLGTPGPGIPESELPHVFEPYWSAKRHAKKGPGLGLYINMHMPSTLTAALLGPEQAR